LGGGADLTPYYLYDDDITFFHGLYRDLCNEKQQQQQQLQQHDDDDDQLFSYPRMKQACDEYFYLPARKEHRGTGGIFFDDMDMTNTTLSFVQDVVTTWMPSWLPIVQKRNDMPVTEEQRQWQLIRRGRYLEFNLLYDRGVKFGLATANPRVEGVMVSAPPLIAFEYNRQEQPNSPESRLLEILKTPKEWV
jgi:coproporphyrinogen III oxidase